MNGAETGVEMVEAVHKSILHRRDVRLGVLALVLICVLLCLAWWRTDIRGALELDTRDGTGGGHIGAHSASFRISGDTVAPISPGVMVPIDLRITNPHGVSLSVTRLSVSVLRVTAPNADGRRPCTAADFALMQARGSLGLRLPALSSKALSGLGVDSATWPRVGMVDRRVNQDGCKGATVTLAYTGFGTLGK